MYCSECGARNGSGAKFCRACGEPFNQLPESQRIVFVRDVGGSKRRGRGKKRAGKRPSLAEGIKNSIVGGGLLTVAAMLAVFMPTPLLMAWFFLFLFVLVMPGLYLLGNGVADVIRARQQPRPAAALDSQTTVHPAASVRELTPRVTSELVPPPSITEEPTQRLEQKLSLNRRVEINN